MIFSSQKPDKLSDSDLVKKFKKNHDLEILGVLFNRYTHLVYGVCLKYLKQREDSQDAVIQIFEILVHEIPKHEIRDFKSWLHGVTRNYCLMELRKKSSQKKHVEKYSSDFFMETVEEMHPIDREENSMINGALEKCLQQLKEEQKQCISLFYYQDKCYKEIALVLNLEEKKVKSYIQNGKRNLKICLEN